MNVPLSKGMPSNISLKVTIEKKCQVPRSVLGKFQVKQISLNFETSSHKLKFRGLALKLFVAFLLL